MRKLWTKLALLAISSVLFISLATAQCLAPEITSFAPTNGNIGSKVTIYGQNFDPVPANNLVYFGATAAQVLTASSTKLVVVVPVGSTYSQIRVQNSCGLTAISKDFFNGIFCSSTVASATFGTRSLQLTSPTAAYGYQMISYDLDKDGKTDLINTTYASNTVEVHRNTSTSGTFSFAAPYTMTLGGPTRCTSVGDFDGDGKPDLVVSVTGIGMKIMRNNSTPGNLSFTEILTIGSYTNPYQNAVADFNRDGKLDFCYTNFDTKTYVAINNSTGAGNFSFNAPIVLNNGPSSYSSISITAADYDGDGKSDIAATTGSDFVFYFRNTTASVSSTSFTYDGAQATGTYPYRIFSADFDRDGKVDVVTNDFSGGSLSVLRNQSSTGTISFASRLSLPAVMSTYRIGVGDADGDGLPDIVSRSSGAAQFSVFINTSTVGGGIAFNPRIDYTSDISGISGIVIGDLDADYVPDISISSGNAINIYRNTNVINDVTPPTARCKNITVPLQLVGGVYSASITAEDIDNGSSDACGIQSIAITSGKTSFTCADLGPNSVTLEVTDNAGLKSTCTATVTITPGVSVLYRQPVDMKLCAGETTTKFFVFAKNDTYTYQWQLSTNGGSTWNNISDNGTYSGAATSILNVNNITSGFNGYKYRAQIFGSDIGCTQTEISASASLLIPAATQRVQTTAGTVQYDPAISAGTVIDNGLTITETSNIPAAKATIAANFLAGDVLDVTGTLPSGVTKSYNSSTGVLSITGTMTPAQAQALLRTAVFKTTASGGSARTITFSLGSGVPYTNGHFYEYVPASVTWLQAKSAAASRTMFGKQGYLATITSSEESTYITSKLSGQAWIGGSDEYQQINEALGNSFFGTQSETEGSFFWATGPESGVIISKGSLTPVAQYGSYINWNTAQPDNWNGIEHYMQLVLGGANSKWNDLPNNSTLGYVVEYGGFPDETCDVYAADRVMSVNTAPTVSTSATQVVCVGTSSTPVPVTITDNESAVTDLTITLTSSNTALIPNANLVLSGTGNSKKLVITPAAGQTGSATITVTATDPQGLSSTGTIAVTVYDCNCLTFSASDQQLNGDASMLGDVITLTPASTGKSGSVWNKRKIDLSKDFEMDTRVYLGNRDAGGADGIAFVLQPQSVNAGSSGGGLGYAGISPSFAVEFDTYNNGPQEPVADHLAVIANGNTSGNHSVYATPYEVEMEDGQWHKFRAIWRAGTKKFEAWYDDIRVFDLNIDLTANIFSNNPYVFMGFTGATGGSYNLQQVQVLGYCVTPQATITLEPGIENPTASTTFCDGGSLVMACSQADTYQWYRNNVAIGGATQQSYTVTNAGTYKVAAVKGGFSSISDDVVVTVNATPAAAFTVNDNTQCFLNNSFAFTNTSSITSGSMTYFWDFGDGSNSAATSPTKSYGSHGTYSVKLKATSSLGCTDSVTHEMIVYAMPTITVEPLDKGACVNTPVTFEVQATGEAITYQWQQSVNGGLQFTDIVGQSSASLTIASPQFSMDKYLYRVIVKGTCSPADTSRAAVLSVGQALSATNPVNQTVCVGASVVFNSIISGGTATSFQWELSVDGGNNWSSIAGATTDILTLVNVTTSQNGYHYRLRYGNSCNSTTTAAATLTVNGTAIITQQPAYGSACEGSNATLAVMASFATSYQWQLNSGTGWSDITGANNNSYTISNVTAAMTSNKYRVIINGQCGSPITSDEVGLRVNELPAISTQPANTTGCESGSATIRLTASGASLTYQWQASTNNGTSWSDLPGETRDSLVLSALSASMNGNLYRAVINSGCFASLTSTNATLTVNSLPRIAVQPGNSAVCEGQNSHFSVTATGTALTYQWELSTDGGATWNNINNNSIYAGATSANLQLSAPPAAMNGHLFRVKVQGACSPSVTSSSASLTVSTLPSITTQPVSNTVCEGDAVIFSVTASGSGIQYQWQQSTNGGSTWSDIAGGNSSNLSLTSLSASSNGFKYRALVSGGCSPAASSSEVLLTVNSLPRIVIPPSDAGICEGRNSSFAVSASGTSLTYQWQISTDGGSTWSKVNNSSVYSGATTATLTLTTPPVSYDGYRYRVILAGACTPSDTSAPVGLSVSRVTVVNTQPVSTTICENQSTGFSIAATGTALTYQWQLSTDAGGSWMDINGATNASLSINNTPASYNGYRYRVIINSACNPAITSDVAVLTVNSLPAIVTQPSNGGICEGTNTTFTVEATGTNLSYQWQLSTNNGATWNNINNNSLYNGASSASLTLTNPPISFDGYRYRVIVSGTCTPAVTSNAASLSISTLPVVSVQPASKTICESESTIFSITASGAGISYQWQVSTDNGNSWNAISGANTAELVITTASAVLNGNKYRVLVNSTCYPTITSDVATLTVNSLPRIVVQPANGGICEGTNNTFSVQASGTNLSYQWQVSTNNGATWNALNDNATYSGALTPMLTVSQPPVSYDGYKYRVIVSGTCAPSVTSQVANLGISTLPVVSTQPVSKTVCEGETVSFNITATGAGVSYQWQRSTDNGNTWSNIENANAASYTIPVATPAMSGYKYRAQVNSSCYPTIISDIASLMVNSQPRIITEPTDGGICDLQNTSFKVEATGTNLSYQWMISTDGGVTWNNINNTTLYTGANSATLTLVRPTASLSGNQYKVLVSGTCSPAVMSRAAQLEISSPPVILTQPVSTVVCEGENSTFRAEVSGTSVNYQWQLSTDNGATWSNIPGATLNTYTITTPTISVNSNKYRLLVNNNCSASIASNTITVTVNTLPRIQTQPQDADICEAQNSSFRVEATGTGLSYQWQLSKDGAATWSDINNNSVYSGAQANVLILATPANGFDGYQYRVIVSGTCTPAVTSSVATLRISTKPVISAQPASVTVCETIGASFRVNASGSGISYQWQLSTDGGSSWNNIDGATEPNYSISATTLQQHGNRYRVIISSACQAPVTSSVAVLTVHSYPRIITQPLSSSICESEPARFTVAASGTDIVYQWYVSSDAGATWNSINNGSLYSGAQSAELKVNVPSPALNGNRYRVVISGACAPAITSDVATLNIGALPVVSEQPASVTVCETNRASFRVTATGSGLRYQWQLSNDGGGTWNNIDGATESVYSISATTPQQQGNRFRVIITSTCQPPVTSAVATLTVHSYPRIVTQPVSSSICESEPARFAVAASGTDIVYQWYVSSDAGATWNSINNGSLYSGAQSAELKVNVPSPALNGNRYRVVISGACAPAITSDAATLSIGALPVISEQPASVTVCEGSVAAFRILASGAGLKYQWQLSTDGGKNWSDLPNATTAQLSVNQVGTVQSGNQYRVMLTGSCGQKLASDAAVMTVNSLPRILSQPASAIVCESQPARFGIQASGSNLQIQWQMSTNAGLTWNNVAGATQDTLLLPAVNLSLHNYLFRAVVSGVCGSAQTSQVASLQVGALPVIISQPVSSIVCEGQEALFIVGAMGSALQYQWQVRNGNSWTDVAGANSSTLRLSKVAAANNGNTYRALVSGSCGTAVASQTAELTVRAKPKADFNSTNSCTDAPVLFADRSNLYNNAPASYLWLFGDGNSSTIANPSHVYRDAGNYSVALVVTPQQCSQLADTVVRTITISAAEQGIRLPYVTAKVGQPVDLAARSRTNTTYTWSPVTGLNVTNISNPVATLSKEQEYQIKMRSAAGCVTVDTLQVKVFAGCEVHLPSGFTPDGDGRNDVFKIIPVCITKINYFRVFNRLGQLLFETNNLNIGWDGTWKGQRMPVDTYTWIVESVLADGTTQRTSGNVTLIR